MRAVTSSLNFSGANVSCGDLLDDLLGEAELGGLDLGQVADRAPRVHGLTSCGVAQLVHDEAAA